MIFHNYFYLLITYHTLLTPTECQIRKLTDVTNETINISPKAEVELPRNKSDVSENIDIRKKMQIEFNEILNTHKNDLRKSIAEAKPKRSTHTPDDTPNNIVKKLDENSKSLLKTLLRIQNESRPVQPTPKKLKSLFITTLRPKKPLGLAKGIKYPFNVSNLGNNIILPITVKADSRESALTSLIKAELKKQDLVPPAEKTTGKDALRARSLPDFRVKEKQLTASIPHIERSLLPNADILDMAPAKGARISNMRFKGRLCHRHVLLPEGPKYDHEGRPYMSAHRAFVERVQKPYHFEQTHPPHLMLPSCCNCCKKSVLGCE